jgi:hypothetical protein
MSKEPDEDASVTVADNQTD